MKKLLAVLLVLGMLLSFGGCFGNIDENNIRGEQTNNISSSVESDETSSSDSDLSLGSINGLNYENKFIGIGLNLDSNWAFYTDEQINEVNSAATDLAGEEYAEFIKNASTFYDMMAINTENQLDSINVVLEKANMLQLAALDIAKNFEANAPVLTDAFKNMGYTNITHNVSTVTIDGKTFDTLNIEAEFSGVKVHQTSIAIKCNGYLATIAVTAYGDSSVADIIDNLYLL